MAELKYLSRDELEEKIKELEELKTKKLQLMTMNELMEMNELILREMASRNDVDL